MDDDFVKKRLERDLADLKRMCDDHFKKRADDDSHITDLEKRISSRQELNQRVTPVLKLREKQKQDRIEKEQQKVQAEKEAKEAKEAADAERKAREAEAKAEILSAMSQGYDKEAARKRRGEKRRLKRRSNAIKAANA